MPEPLSPRAHGRPRAHQSTSTNGELWWWSDRVIGSEKERNDEYAMIAALMLAPLAPSPGDPYPLGAPPATDGQGKVMVCAHHHELNHTTIWEYPADGN
jgi:hypothetical protein